MDDVLILVSYTGTQDAKGVWKDSQPVLREVYCEIGEITRQEFFSAGRNGFSPEFEFIVAAIDYNGERECVYHGKTYSIYRTYRDLESDYIELYVEMKGGLNGKVDLSGTSVC